MIAEASSTDKLSGRWKVGLMTAAVLAALFLPFINKAVHIDDTTFLNMSGAIHNTTYEDDAVEGYFLGKRSKKMSPMSSIHPAIPYFLKFINTVSGGRSETIYHAFYLMFPALLAIGMYGICTELKIPFFITLLFVAGNAAYLPVSHTLMADSPTLSLLAMSLFLFVSGLRTGRNASMAVSSLFLVLAVGVSYHSVFIIAVLLIYLVAYERNRKTWIIIYSLPVLCLISGAIYLHLFQDLSLAGIVKESLRGIKSNIIGGKVVSILVNMGMMTLFLNPLLFMNDADSKLKRSNMYILLISAVVSIVCVAAFSYPFFESVWLIALTASGIFFLIRISRDIFRYEDLYERKILILLFSWLWIVIIYNIVLTPFGALRYLLPVLLPSVLIAMIVLKKTGLRLLYAAVALTVILGIAVSYGDYIFASSYRDLAADVSRRVGQDNKRIWFIGDWGMQYYMRKKGYRYLTAKSNDPVKGDLIFIADKQKMWGPSRTLYSRMELIDIIEHKSWFPVRVMGSDMNVGYYSHLWGLQPFTLSSAPVERFGVFRVVR